MNWQFLFSMCAGNESRKCLFIAAWWMALAECQDWQRQQILNQIACQDMESWMRAADSNSMPINALARLIAQPY